MRTRCHLALYGLAAAGWTQNQHARAEVSDAKLRLLPEAQDRLSLVPRGQLQFWARYSQVTRNPAGDTSQCVPPLVAMVLIRNQILLGKPIFCDCFTGALLAKFGDLAPLAKGHHHNSLELAFAHGLVYAHPHPRVYALLRRTSCSERGQWGVRIGGTKIWSLTSDGPRIFETERLFLNHASGCLTQWIGNPIALNVWDDLMAIELQFILSKHPTAIPIDLAAFQQGTFVFSLATSLEDAAAFTEAQTRYSSS
jgi:hypothetical protein